MKSLKLVTTLAIAAALMMGVTGCKKTPKNVTNIPRTRDGVIQDDASRNILGGPKIGSGDQSGRLPGDSGLNSTGLGNTTSTTLTPEQIAAGQNQDRRPPEGAENRTALASETVYFDYDRSTVKGSEVPKVQRVATYLKNQPTAYLRVEGNCDERGTEEYNRSLGERRALAVRELLIASGVPADRVTTLTNGEDKPADPGHDESAFSKNRRAEFVVITPEAGGIR
jgi:peptidoglycan-associated lipoprotein